MTIAAIYGTAVDTNVIRLPSGQVKHVPIKRVGSNYLPRPIRRARGCLARGKVLERKAYGYVRRWGNNVPNVHKGFNLALGRQLRAKADEELARAAMHALQWLLAT